MILNIKKPYLESLLSSKSDFKAPKNIRIGGRTIRVKQDVDLDEHGRYYHMQKLIIIDPEKEDPHATLIHEAMHAALAVGGLTEMLDPQLEEAICVAAEMLAPSIYWKMPKAKKK